MAECHQRASNYSLEVLAQYSPVKPLSIIFGAVAVPRYAENRRESLDRAEAKRGLEFAATDSSDDYRTS